MLTFNLKRKTTQTAEGHHGKRLVLHTDKSRRHPAADMPGGRRLEAAV